MWLRTQGGGGNTGKCSTWEGGHRVVGAARWTGRIPAGSVSDALVSTLDFLPTIAHLAGVDLHSDRYYDGINLGPVLFDGATEAHDTLYHPNNCEGRDGDINTVRAKQYKAKVGEGFEKEWGGYDGRPGPGLTLSPSPTVVVSEQRWLRALALGPSRPRQPCSARQAFDL
jgi:arylsulfatase A-like enzyme